MDFDGDYDYEPDPEELPRDTKIDEAKEELRSFFSDRSKEVFYERQLQVIFEKQFFHWITVDALRELVAEDQSKQNFSP